MYSSILNTDLNSQNYALLDLSAKVEYALLALLELASHHDKKVPLTMSEIAAKQPIPERYLEQILTQVRRAGLGRVEGEYYFPPLSVRSGRATFTAPGSRCS